MPLLKIVNIVYHLYLIEQYKYYRLIGDEGAKLIANAISANYKLTQLYHLSLSKC